MTLAYTLLHPLPVAYTPDIFTTATLVLHEYSITISVSVAWDITKSLGTLLCISSLNLVLIEYSYLVTINSDNITRNNYWYIKFSKKMRKNMQMPSKE